MYNVGFGDCFLVKFDTDERPYTMLIDCGQLSGSAGNGPDFWDVVERLVADLPVLDGRPRLDVIVMTHRHRDHVHGFSRKEVWRHVKVGEVWMPWTENPNDPDATRLRSSQESAARNALSALHAFGASPGDAMDLALNSMTNNAAMDTLFYLAEQSPRYLPEATASLSTRLDAKATRGALPQGVVVHVLGPSIDPKVIAQLNPPKGQSYLRFGTLEFDNEGSPRLSEFAVPSPWKDRPALSQEEWLHLVSPATTTAGTESQAEGGADPAYRARSVQSALKSLDGLISQVHRGSLADAENLAFTIDKALNGTSLVLLIEACGHLLLFPGDAQWGTWSVILETREWQDKLRRVTFLKVGHHGSHNATPRDFVERGYLHRATAMVSVAPTRNTAAGWMAIPRPGLLEALSEKSRVTRLIMSDDGMADTLSRDGQRGGRTRARRLAFQNADTTDAYSKTVNLTRPDTKK
jgi:beta-lactamase superfamily II metal-dependent hydrolase